MMDSFTRGEAFLNPVVIVGGLLIVVLVIVVMIRKKKESSEVLMGGFSYTIDKESEQLIRFNPVKEMDFSIGPKKLSENHLTMKKGSSFKFSVSAEQSNSGDKFISIRCEPPGLLRHRGEVKTTVYLYSGEEFIMNNVSIMYSDGKDQDSGKNILEGRI